MVEAGDITAPEKKSGGWFTMVKDHGMLNTDRITTVNSDSISMDVTDSYLILSCNDGDHTMGAFWTRSRSGTVALPVCLAATSAPRKVRVS